MLKVNRTYLLLLLIFTFSFMYRMLLMLWDGFPPGADIGLHNSVIYSITGSGNVDFLYNFYHIGGGISLTFPGYHIFTASVIMLTGLPEYIAHAVVVALFSSLIVLCAFLITKRVWSTPAAFIVAFLAAISRFDIEMLMWAGYPNVITLFLIPLTFYLYLVKDRFYKVPFFVSTSILAGSLFLTHSLSGAMFGAITAAIMLFVFVYPQKIGVPKKEGLYWILPIFFGAILVSPFLVQAIPMYLSQYGYDEIAAATIATRILPLEIVLPLFGITAAFFVFSKKLYKKFLVLPTLLLAIWVFLPLILTQGYLVGLPVDYNRFLYFLVLPVLVFIAVLIDYGSEFFAGSIDKYRASRKTQIGKEVVHKKLAHISGYISHALIRKRLYSIFVLFFLLFSFVVLPIFCTPTLNVGEALQNYYQTMDNQGWEALQWIKHNTIDGSVLVSDALYGWWLGGFAQRPTISAVDPEYLTVKREADNATFARNLMDTDYIIDNNYSQIREDGYVSRHNPEILAKQNWTYSPYSFFNFNSNTTEIRYHFNSDPSQSTWLDDLWVKDIRVENDSRQAKITVTRGNDGFDYVVSTTVYRDIYFVNLTFTLTSLRSDLHFDWVDMEIETKGVQVSYNKDLVTIGLVDVGTKSLGQLIFITTPDSSIVKGDSVRTVQLSYALGSESQSQIQMLAGAYSESNNPAYYSSQGAIDEYFLPIVNSNLNSALQPMNEDYDIVVFNYRLEIQNRSISYIVCRNAEIEPKFRDDPLFSRVFINKGVAIYKVNWNLNQG